MSIKPKNILFDDCNPIFQPIWKGVIAIHGSDGCLITERLNNTELSAIKRQSLVAFTGIGTEIFGKLVRHVHKVISVGWRRFLACDVGPNLGVFAVKIEPLFEPGSRVGLDGVHRAFRLAYAAVDALVRMNDEHVLALVKAVYWADLDTVCVLATNAAIGDDVSHW